MWAVWDGDDFQVKIVIVHNHKKERFLDLPLTTLLDHDGWMWEAIEDHLDTDFLKKKGSWTWREQWLGEIPELLGALDGVEWAACTGCRNPGQGPYLDWDFPVLDDED